ncbi:SOS response-associated peptidase [Hyphobacterium sp. CCMP332]|uniref:SOS response-associated peptidase n=1 Tax=Hyphobacterium sp. CCMP332 TaxID=2749086 RepID=UPI00164F6A8D|nr:SOS response-associated peptidase [Hyphobacterium sp. CCMP332]QNL19211.1 SOS response-associated peptidase [Hyphobacterium sp. CCMP332]
MCGRYDIEVDAKALSEMLGLDVPDFVRDADFSPGDTGPVIAVGQDGQTKVVLMRWGLEPGWLKEKPTRPMFNARAETVAEKPMFRAAFKRKRALVPAVAFYEWTGKPGAKTKWRFSKADGSLLIFAGLWEARDRGDGEKQLTFTVLTTTPNADAADYHDRMPVVLDEKAQKIWLDPEADPQMLLEMAAPAPDGTLTVAAA